MKKNVLKKFAAAALAAATVMSKHVSDGICGRAGNRKCYDYEVYE